MDLPLRCSALPRIRGSNNSFAAFWSAKTMQVVCVDCGTETEASVGYCARCGGIRMIQGSYERSGDTDPRIPPSPLILSRVPQLDQVLLKYEGGHITGSFKDRIMSVTIKKALEHGATGAVVPSS